MGSVVGDQRLHSEGTGTGQQARFASGDRCEGVNIHSLLQTIGEVEVASGSSLTLRSLNRQISSGETAVAMLGSSVDFPSWKRGFEGLALSNDCMQALATATDIPLGDPSVTFRFVLDQGFSEGSIRRARVACTCLTEIIMGRELLCTVFDTNSPSAGWRLLCNGFLPTTIPGARLTMVQAHRTRHPGREEVPQQFW